MPSRDPKFIPVVMERSCFLGIIMAAMEVYSRETIGLLVGRNARRFIRGSLTDCVLLEEAYPLQTAKRAFSFVMVKNKKAFNRARKTAAAYGFSVLGEFHSHPKRKPVLTTSDKRYIREEIINPERRELKLVGNRWLELVVGISRRSYKRAQRTGWFPKKGSRAPGTVKGILRTNPRSGFEISIKAWWVGLKAIKETPLYYSAY
jgi:proteasome lid subunit RPN8/RPN11